MSLTHLAESKGIWGDVKVLSGSPTMNEHSDVVFVPFKRDLYHSLDSEWGTYTTEGDLILDAAYLRGGAKDPLVGQSYVRYFDSVPGPAPEPCYIYGGPYLNHYGHFICDTLARLWFTVSGARPSVKLILHSHQELDYIFETDFSARCFEALGIRKSDVFIPTEPCRIERLLVPLPSFEEQSFVRGEFRDTARRIGFEFLSKTPWEQKRPAYMSKTRLQVGVTHVMNEKIIEDYLGDKGVDIIYPEQLTFPEQVKFFSESRTIIGTAGSAFHTSLFSPPRSELIYINPFDQINSNTVMIDLINGNSARYYHPIKMSKELQDENGFQTSRKIIDPVGVAEDMVRLLHS